MSGTNPYFDGFTRLHGVDAALRQHAPVEEGVAGPIREFDKSKPLFGIEPFDESVDWRTGGCLERLAEPGSSAESTGLKVVRVSVEFATPRLTKILICQLCFLEGWCLIIPVEREWLLCHRSEEVLV